MHSRSSPQRSKVCIGMCHFGDPTFVLRAASGVSPALPLLDPTALACLHDGSMPSQPLQSSAYLVCCLSHLVAQDLSHKRSPQGRCAGLWPALSVSLDVKRLGCPCGTIQVTGDQSNQWLPQVRLLRPDRVHFTTCADHHRVSTVRRSLTSIVLLLMPTMPRSAKHL